MSLEQGIESYDVTVDGRRRRLILRVDVNTAMVQYRSAVVTGVIPGTNESIVDEGDWLDLCPYHGESADALMAVARAAADGNPIKVPHGA